MPDQPSRVAQTAFDAVPSMIGQAFGTGRRLKLAGGHRRIYLHHIRKTGGTAVTNAILSLGGERPSDVEARLARFRPRVTRTGDLVVAAHDRAVLHTSGYSYGWSHLPSWQVRLRPRTYTVTVLRDPVSRVISLYRYLLDPHSDDGFSFRAHESERVLARGGFERFLADVPQSELLNQLYMFSKRFDPHEAAEQISECSLAFFIEDMATGIDTLARLTGRHLTVRAERASAKTFEPSREQRERLRESLRADYEMIALLRPTFAAPPE